MPQIVASQVAELLKQAQTFQTQGRFDDAIGLCEQILESGFDRPDTRYFLGWLYQEQQRWDEAIRQFQMLLNDPDYALSCYYALGQCYRACGDLRTATVHFDEAVDRVNLGMLTVEESDQLVQLCQEAAETHHLLGEQEQALTIYNALLGFLRSRGWTEKVLQVEFLLQQIQDAFAPARLTLPTVVDNSAPSFSEKVELMTQMSQPKDTNEQSSPSTLLSQIPKSQPNHDIAAVDASSLTLKQIQHQILSLSDDEQKETIVRAFRSLSSKEKDEIIHQVGIRPITQEATDFIWKVVVSGAVLVFVGSAIAIGVAVFMNVNVAPLITIFTAVIAFLGGLLAPSPLQNAVRSLSSSIKASSKEGDKE